MTPKVDRAYRCLLTFAVLVLVLSPALARASLDDIQINGWVSSAKPEVNQAITLTISLRNAGPTTVGPIEIEMLPPFTLAHDLRQSLSRLELRPKQWIFRTATIRPSQKGPVPLVIRLRVATSDEVRHEHIGSVEVLEPPSIWQENRDLLASVVPMSVATLAVLATIGVQLFVLRGARRQKTAESVATMVVNQGREYYAGMSGALRGLQRSLDKMATAAEGERKHLLRRAFFFFGMFLYKENEFPFSHGFMYLPHLWAEEAVAWIILRVFELVPLTQRQEAVVHKCFSDIERLHNASHAGDVTVVFKARTLYELEQLLLKDNAEMSEAERELREVYGAVCKRLTDGAVASTIGDLERALRAIIEYEFTEVFREWYGGGAADRAIPELPPEDFEAISGGTADWQTVRRTLGREEGWLEKMLNG